MTLDDLAVYKKGPFGSSLTKSMFVPNGQNTFKVYEQKNAIQKDATLGHYYISSEKFEELKGFEVHPNDIIVSCAGTIGETFVLPNNIQRGIINQALMIIRLFESSIQRFYLEYFDFVLKNNAAKEGKGTAIKNIPPFDVLKSYPFPLPPIDEQKRISNKLDSYFGLIQLIDNSRLGLSDSISNVKSKILKLAMQGRLVAQDSADEPAAEMLRRVNPKARIIADNPHYPQLPSGWIYVTLSEVISTIPSKKHQIQQREIQSSGLFPVVSQSNNFIEGYSDKSDLVFSNNGGCVVFGDHTRNVKLIDFDFVVGADGLKIIIWPFNVIFLFYLCEYIAANIPNRGYSRHFQFLTNYEIGLPPLAEQKRIVAKIEELYSVLDQIEASLRG